jgi:uncharacterized lipoprotein YddW (UPF0748 family)
MRPARTTPLESPLIAASVRDALAAFNAARWTGPASPPSFRAVRLPFPSVLALAFVLACGAADDVRPPVPPDPPAATRAPPADVTATSVPTAAPRPLRLALWVPCEGSQRVLEHPDRVPGLLADARALGATDLFVQVYRGGRAWYDASLADARPFAAARDAAGGDPLRALVAAAHAAGLRVHAWVNVLSLASHRDGPLLAALGPAAPMVDRRGRSVLDYPNLELPAPDSAFLRFGTPAVWIDPAAPGVANALSAVFAELVARYPELDGLHLDYIRHPDVLPFSPGSRFGVGLDFGYGEATRARFRAETALEAPLGDAVANGSAWDAWRRERVTELVRAIAGAARRARPGVLVSAAVWASPDRSYLSLFQDWPRWVDERLLDFAVPMAYTVDDPLFGVYLRSYAGLDPERLWAGIGSWLFADSPERGAAQLRRARASGLAGVSLFSWDAIAEAPGLRDALAAEASHAGP